MNNKYNMEFNLDEIYQTRRPSKTNTANIPAYLREHGLFCLWKYETKEDGTTTKVPYNPNSPQYHAQSNDRRTFAPLETAAARVSGFDGLGVGIFDAVAAIDIDHCIKDGKLSAMAEDIVNTMDAYTEKSPSGEGVRILFFAPDFSYDSEVYYVNNQKIGLEVYLPGMTRKYVSITGNTMRSHDMLDRSDRLPAILDKYMKRPQQIAQPATPRQPGILTDLSDRELIDKAMNAANGRKFSKLWEGDISDYQSHSEADQALCNLLAFWTGKDAARIEALFMQSGLNREEGGKYKNPAHYAKYLQTTINKAIVSCESVYEPMPEMIVEPPAEPVQEAQQTDYSAEIRQAAMQLDEPAALEYLASRGISPETAARFAVGYISNFAVSPSETWEVITIPTGNPLRSYIVRNIAEGDRYKNRGSAQLFNAKAIEEANTRPLFITEGEIDALSIEEVGGCAVGLGSADNTKLIDAVADQIQPDRLIILALDNDKAGMEATERLRKILQAHNRRFEEFNPYGTHKSANEALTADRETFTDKIINAEKLIRERRLQEYRANESAYGMMNDFIDAVYQNKFNEPISTGFPQFDKIIHGGLHTGLYVIGAISSLGKTTLALQIGDQIAAGGHDVMIFSLEMGRNELIGKSISRNTLEIGLELKKTREYAVDYYGVTDGSLYDSYSQQQKNRIAQAIQRYSTYAPRLIIKQADEKISVNDITASVENHKHITGEYPVVIVDYLQILKPADVHMTDKQSVDDNISSLRRLARNTPVIAISSVNRESYKEGGKSIRNAGKVALSDLKESGGIEYGADYVIGLQFSSAGTFHKEGGKEVSDYDEEAAKQEDPRNVTAVLLKARFTQPCTTCSFRFIPQFNYFEEVKRTQQSGIDFKA